MKPDRDRVFGILLTMWLVAGAAYLAFQPGFLGYYFFGPGSTPWYERAVWGNVWAAAPCGVLAFLYARAKLAAHRKAQQQEHQERLAQAEQHHVEQMRLLKAHQDEQREHNRHVWKHVSEIYETTTGKKARPHPLEQLRGT